MNSVIDLFDIVGNILYILLSAAQNMPMDTLNSKETIWSIDRRYVLFNSHDVQSDSKNNLYSLDHQM